MNRFNILIPVTLLCAGCESTGTTASPLQTTDAFLQALVKGNADKVANMFLTPQQFGTFMKCDPDNESGAEFEAMIAKQKEAMSALAKGQRPAGFMAEVVEFEIRDRDFEEEGSEQGGCVFTKDVETARVKFRYQMGTSPEELEAFRAEKGKIHMVKVGKRWLLIQSPEMEAFEVFDTVKQPSGSPSEFKLTACRAEVPTNVKGIQHSEHMINAHTDQYLYVEQHPSARVPGKEAQSWAGGNDGFNTLNWMPDGKVRGVYGVSTTATSSTTPGGDFEVTGRIDCDGDGVEAIYTATKSINATLTTPADVY